MSSSPIFVILFLHLAGLTLLVAMPTCKLNGNQVTTAHNLLRDMGAQFPVHCLSQQNNVVSNFPTDAFNSQLDCSQTSLVIYETLRKIYFLFDTEELPVSYWDENKHDDFQNILYRLVEESCLKSKVAGSISPPLDSFFNSLTTHLHTDRQVNRQCVWEGIRRELISCLQFILQHFNTCLS